jgi:chromosome condensin MukBEF MukE localization factor
MKTLADDVPGLDELIEEAMANMRRLGMVRNLRNQCPSFWSDEHVEKVVADLEKIKDTAPLWWQTENEIERIWQSSVNERVFQNKMNERFTKKGENMEFYWVWL